MVPFQLEIFALVAVLVGFIVNTYIVVIVILTKQITFASKVLLLHLGIVNTVLCLCYCIFYAISLLQLLPVGLEAMDVTCLLFGLCFNTLHSIALWTLCALNFDRYFAIATPLHYGTYINTKKVLITLGAGWIVSTLFSLPQAARISAYKFDNDYALCLPNSPTTESLVYSVSFVLFTILLPIILILGCNMKVLMIARYQRNRIASAILEVTLSAQLTITHQRNPFFVQGEAVGPGAPRRPGGTGALADPGGGLTGDCKACTQPGTNQNNPAANVIQLVGSAILFHCPYYFVILWNSVLPFVTGGSWRTPALLLNLAFFLLLLSPTINAILYGVRSKIVRRSLRNIWRKQKQKMEIHYEIQARTPSTCGSRRPSLSGAQQQQQQQQQQPLLVAFADGGTRSEVSCTEANQYHHPSAAISRANRIKFGSCSALATPSPSIAPTLAAHVQHELLAAHGQSAIGIGIRPKITITKILADDDDEPAARTRLLSDSSATEASEGGSLHYDDQRCGAMPPPTSITIPPTLYHYHTDNRNVARQSGAKPTGASSAIRLEPQLAFRKFCSLQEILGTE
ncbi:trace amine-associated receptor 4-like isoform X2 [Anopheles darlingi]|uniref:trace amine-associated receptor 4-like isoform X2 n=1 Tax=Anopheles darlingi TaxID=43151 RepID=UPI0021004310|nr:trace amine-associated receptor 4-like isoform X2 [Anopheles darlingi]